jgi:hypothetical protein
LAISDTVAHTVNPFATHQNALGMKRTIVSNHARKRETPVLKDGNRRIDRLFENSMNEFFGEKGHPFSREKDEVFLELCERYLEYND